MDAESQLETGSQDARERESREDPMKNCREWGGEWEAWNENPRVGPVFLEGVASQEDQASSFPAEEGWGKYGVQWAGTALRPLQTE